MKTKFESNAINEIIDYDDEAQLQIQKKKRSFFWPTTLLSILAIAGAAGFVAGWFAPVLAPWLAAAIPAFAGLLALTPVGQALILAFTAVAIAAILVTVTALIARAIYTHVKSNDADANANSHHLYDINEVEVNGTRVDNNNNKKSSYGNTLFSNKQPDTNESELKDNLFDLNNN